MCLIKIALYDMTEILSVNNKTGRIQHTSGLISIYYSNTRRYSWNGLREKWNVLIVPSVFS